MKVITFSRQFPLWHPRAGSPTYFVEKICDGLRSPIYPEVKDIDPNIFQSLVPKHHTIRENENWKVGDVFSPRIWSGRPYRSKQIEFTSPIEVKKIFKFKFLANYEIHIDGKFYCSVGSSNFDRLAMNDGLDAQGLLYWFPTKPFRGQIICWNNNITY